MAIFLDHNLQIYIRENTDLPWQKPQQLLSVEVNSKGCTLIYELVALVTTKAPHDCVQYVLLARYMYNKKQKNSDPPEKS